MTEAETQDMRAKIENLTPEQTDKAWQILAGERTEFYVQMDKILLDHPPLGGYIDDNDVKRVLTELMHEAYVADAIAQVTERN